ncbi:MAG: hypothetical protein IPI67_28450 [Myxococcales bacterium]|nr:hypothetical protein [Myxococcales bacterium]
MLNTPGYAVNANVVKDSITGLEWPTPEQGLWTSTPRRSDPTKSLLVDFASGTESFDTASVPHRARCVRGLP